MTDFNIAPYIAAGRHVVTYGAGIATAVGVMSMGQSNDVIAGFDHLFKGFNEIAAGLGILAPIAAGAYAAISATLKHQVAGAVIGEQAGADGSAVRVVGTGSSSSKSIGE